MEVAFNAAISEVIYFERFKQFKQAAAAEEAQERTVYRADARAECDARQAASELSTAVCRRQLLEAWRWPSHVRSEQGEEL